MSCVNISSKEFKDTTKRLNVSSENLETIVNEIQNSLNDPDYFPSDEEVLERLHGTSFKASDAQAQLYELKNLGTPQEFSNLAIAMRQVSELQQWFPDEAVKCYKNANGIYEVRVARPISEKALREGNDYTPEMQSIKDKAIADGTFMKAPNGKPTNLNERQWLQVRTKAFKDWFGDWEKAANANRVSLGKKISNTDKYSKYGQKGETDVEIREVLDEKGNIIGTVRMEFSGKGRKGVVTLHPNLIVTGKGYGTALYQHIADTYNINVEESFGEIGKSEAAKKLWNKIANTISKDPDIQLRQLTPSNSSKVVDENGEPKVMYHGTPWGEFNEFRHFSPNTGDRTPSGHLYFSANKFWAETYTKGEFNKGTNSPTLYEVFLNIRNPFNYRNPIKNKQDFINELSKYWEILPEDVYDTISKTATEEYNLSEKSNFSPYYSEYIYRAVADYYKNNNDLEGFNIIIKKLADRNFNDGIIWLLRNENSLSDVKFDGTKRQVVVFNPNQIKSATSNTGEFSTTNDNIYYSVLNEGRESSKSWETLVKEEPTLKLLSKEQAQKVQQALKKHIKDEFTRAIHPNIYKEYFNEANKQGYSFSTVTKAIDDIISKTNNTEIRVLAEFIKKYINKEVAKVSITYSTKNKGKETGDYNSSTKEITIYKKAANGVTEEQAKEAFEKTILHEVVHAITVDYLQSNSQAEKDIARIMRQLDNAIKSGNESLNIYAFESPYEFIAEFMSKPLLREATKHIPYQDVNGKTNVFKKIFDIIKNAFLNLSGKNKNITLYDKAMDALTNIMEDSYAYQNIESLENTTRDTQVSKESRIEKARRAIKIFKGKSKRAEEKNRKALIENYYSSIDIDTRQQVANYAIERLNSIYSNYTPTITEGQNIEEAITNKERELTKKFSKFVDSVKFEKNGDSYSLVITPKDISTVLRKNIEEAVNSKTAEEVVQELEAIESGVKFDPEYYLSNKKAEEAKRVISNRNNVQTEEEIDAALDFLKSLENTPDLNQYVSLCINWLKDNQIRLPEDNEKLIPLFEYARDHNMDTQKFKSVADLWKAIVNDKTAIAEKATPIEDPTSYYGITYNRTEKHKDGDILIFDVEDSERGQDSVCQILADFAPKLKNGKTRINSPWCLATFNYSASDKIATATNSARNFWKDYPNGKRQIAIMNGVPVAFNSSKYNRDEWWDYKDGCDNNYHGYSTIQEIDTNFLNISKLSFTNNSIRSLPLRNSLISPINGGEDYEVLSGEKDFSISEVKSLTIPDKVSTYLSLFGTTIPGHHFIKISIDKSDAVDLLFKVSPIRKRDLYLLEEEEEGKKTLQELDNTLAELYKMIHKAKQITNVTKKMVQPYRDSITDNLTKLKNIADKILQEEEERRQKESKERQERRRALQATPTENTVTEAIQENEVLNTLSEAVNTNRPYETSREYEAAEEAEEYAQEVNREYGTNIEGETVRDAQEHVKARTLQEQYEKGVKQKVNKELSSQLHDILKRYHFEIIEGDLKQLFGEDALGALDILQKIVYLAKEEDRNALTDVEEFSHAFIELMGSKYRRETRENHPENKLYSDLRDLVEQTSLYQETLKQYRDTYQTRQGTPDLAKIKKEALGKALAATINNRFEVKTEADKSFFKKIKQWFKDVIQNFKGLLKGNEDRLIAELNKIADSILDGTYDKKYLKDSGIEGLLNQSYQEVIEGQTEKDGGRTLSIMQTLANKGLAVGGSLALRAQGTVYRSQIESLHDLDYSAGPAVHGILLGEKTSFNMTQEEQEAFAQKAINSSFIQDLRNSLPANDIVSAYKADRNGIVSFIICDDASIRERFINDSGSYSDRLSKFTQEERDKITLLDVFLNEYTKKSKNLTDGTKVLDSSEIFDAKLRMGRAKDIFDYQHFNPASREQRANRNVMFQKNETPVQQSTQPVQQSTEQAAAKTKTIEYTPKGKTRQTYTVEGNRIFNKNGVEVFQADSKDRRRIFANLAIQEGRAVIVEYKEEQYVVNNRDQIISIKTGNEVWKNTPKNNNRLAIIEAARQKFAARNTSQQATPQNIQMPTLIFPTIESYKGNWTREEAARDTESLYIFTDNTDRDSGKGLIDPMSKYSQKYGRGKHYPTKNQSVQAVLRGLDNAMPLSTQRWYHKGAKGVLGRWTDADFEEFKRVIDSEIDDIIKEWKSGRYKRIVISSADGFFNAGISNISIERTPKLYQYLKSKLEQIGIKTTESAAHKQLPSELSNTNTNTINIYAGTGENAHFSNFAERPFTIQYEDLSDILEIDETTGDWLGNILNENNKFKTVEGAFQASKIAFSSEYKEANGKFTNEGLSLIKKLQEARGAEAKSIGRNIKGLNTQLWDKASSNIMKLLIKNSFKQNPEALQQLLATGNAQLTHTQDKGKWGKEFPKLLMEVREELNTEKKVNKYVHLSGKDSGFLTKEGEELLSSTFDKSKFNKGTTKVSLYPVQSGTALRIDFKSQKTSKDFYVIYYGNANRKVWDLYTSDGSRLTNVKSDQYWKNIRTIVPKALFDLVESGKYAEMDNTAISKDDLGSIIYKTELEEFFEQEYKVLSRGRSASHNTKVVQKALNMLESTTEEGESFTNGKSTKESNNTARYGVEIDPNLKSNYAEWQKNNPKGIVAYRVNYNVYNTAKEALEGRIGNPFSDGAQGEATVNQFYNWLITGNNFGNSKATAEYRLAIIQRILNTPEGSPILYYKELGRASHATILGYLVNHKELFSKETLEALERFNKVQSISKLDKIVSTTENSLGYVKEVITDTKTREQEVTENLDAFFTVEERKKIEEALGKDNRKLRVVSASRRSDPVFFSEQIIKMLENNAKLPIGHPERIYAIEVWSKHDGLPMVDILKACQKYRVAPMVSFSISTLGNTVYEKGVLKYNDLLDRIEDFVKQGILNPSTTTFRVDPILPGVTNLEDIEKVVARATKLGIKHFVTSIMQSYGNTEGLKGRNNYTGMPNDRGIVQAFREIGYDWETYYGFDGKGKVKFLPKEQYIGEIREKLIQIMNKYNMEFKSCSFNRLGLKHAACLDPAMIEAVTGVSSISKEKTNERSQCDCYGYKSDTLKYSDKCLSSCLYCYAGHGINTPLQYYNDDGSINKSIYTETRREEQQEESFEPTVNTNTKKNQLNKSSSTIKDENKTYMEKTKELVKQIDNLYNSPLMSVVEIRHVANQMAYWVSDAITEYQNNPEKIFENFPNKRTLIEQDGKEVWTEENKAADLEKIKSYESRIELVNYIGIENLLTLCKERLVDDDVTSTWEYTSTIDKADLIYDNFDAIMLLSSDTFRMLEGFSLSISQDGKTLETSEETETSSNIDNFEDNSTDIESQRTDGVVNRDWTVDVKTIDVINELSGAIKRMLSNCFILEDNGRVDEEGNKQYDPVKSEFGIKERIDLRTATNSILKWTQGAITVEQMIDKLKEKVEDNPWITQVIDTLSKKENAQLKSQFFSVFYKPFQTYSVVSQRKGKYISSIVNEETLLKQTLKNIEAQVKIGEHPLFTLNGINKTSLDELRKEGNNLWALTKSENLDFTNEEFVNNVATSIGYISNLLGYYISPDVVKVGLSEPALTEIKGALKNIINTLKQNQDNSEFNPFDFESGIKGNIRSFLRPLTEYFEDLEVSSFYDCGKMYQSYSTPSYTAKLFQKFKLHEKDFESFIKEEFYTPWFHTGNKLESGWRNEWIRLLVTNSKAREIFKHKTQLNFNRKNYMKTMTDKELTLSIFTEYFSERASSKESMVPAWFRIATLSNKPSLEFIRFYSYRGDNYKDVITNLLHNVFLQELSRIQTVELRNLKEGDYGYIEHFDESGRKFLFLDYMNKYLKGGEKENTQLGNLIQKSLKEKLSTQEELKLAEFSKGAIKANMEEKAKSIVNKWKENGIVKAAENIDNIGTSEEEILSNLENFIWNDTFASINILQLTVTDLAFYGNAVNLQKRLAQIHAPGIRGDVYATDFEGNPVSDTKFRTAKITDYFDIKSNIIENLKIVFDRKIKAADGTERKGYEMLKEALVGTDGIYHKINVTDGQGYSCPTSYRKKAFIFGRWTKEAEEIYKKIKDGKATYIEIEKAFQPFKPFVYSQIIKDVNISEAPLSSLKVPIQFKNSEYLLILADAILQGEETGRPNLLRAIFNVMEDSHFDQKTGKYKTDGIDTIQFESTTKSGLSTPINIAEFIENPNGEALATAKLKAYIYKTEEVKGEEGEKSAYRMTNQYDLNVVDVMPFEDFSIQQEIPEHFKNHEQPQGSQERYITIADLENFDADGNVIKYNLGEKEVTAEEFKQEYEQLINQNIEEDINTLAKELSLDTLSMKDRNIAISKILQREILSSPRYGVDLFIACSVNEDGQFRIPLGDPIQSKRIEQLLNSVIKNRINKQKMPGGPLVQVTNFGTSRKLNIRFKDKTDKTGKTLVKLRSEFKGTDSEYADYLAKHQGGIAYYEAFVPIYANELFTKFADKDGNIDVASIEQINPDLLKAIGYRIPTEDKYSMMPIKIVGFLPKEAGDAIMLPYEITGITGADFDVDKMYIMLKKLNIASRVIPKPGENLSEAEEDYFKHNKQSIRKYLIKTLNLKGKITNNKEYAKITARAESNADLQRKAIEREYNERLQRLNKNDDAYQERNDEIKSDKSFNKAEERREKRYNDNLEKLNNWKKEQLNKIERTKENEILKSKVNEEVDKFLKETRYQSSKFDNALEADLRKAYIDYMYHTIEDSLNTRVGRNNRIFDMTYEVLTHESSVDKILNPGNFEEQKLMGYQVEAFRSNPDYTWEQIKGMKIKELKKLIEKDKNLLYIDDNIHFYNQNNAGGSLLGIFAVNKIAHAIIESGGVNGSPEYFINIDKATDTINEEFTVAGMKFSGHMGYDVRTDLEGKLVGKTLGSLVAASADTAKDPVLSLLNINGDTVNVLNTLLRLGMPFRTAALFISQDVIRNLLEEYNIKNIVSKTSLGSILSEKIKQIEKEYSIDTDSELLHQDLTVEEMIDGLRPDAAYSVQYKTLRAFQKLRKIASATELINNATRANSMSDAVGPLLIDNLLAKYKAEILNNESCIVDSDGIYVTIGRIQYKHPILKGFSRTKELANDLFINMPERSADFTYILDLLSQSNLKGAFFLKGNTSRRILNKLGEFYKTALLMSKIGSSKEQLKYIIEEFPKEFIRENYKEKYPNNLLIQSILYSINEEGRATLQVNTTGLDTIQKSKYADAWTELHKINPKLSTQLYIYNLYKGGIGFNPKTFMHLLPIYVKERLDNYIGTFRNLPSVDPLTIIDRFIRNNWTDKNLVPSVKYKEGQFYTTENGDIVINKKNINQFKNLDWFISSNEELSTLYKRKFYQEETETLIFEEVTPLGNNGEYIEIQETALNNTDRVIEDTSEESIGKEEVLSDSEALSTEEVYDSVMFKGENRDYKEDVKALISNVLSRIQKDNTIENNSQSREKIINMVEERLKSFNIEIDKEKLKKESKKLCD